MKVAFTRFVGTGQAVASASALLHVAVARNAEFGDVTVGTPQMRLEYLPLSVHTLWLLHLSDSPVIPLLRNMRFLSDKY